MQPGPPSSQAALIRLVRVLALVLALVCQAAGPAMALAAVPAPSAESALEAATILCAAGHQAGTRHAPPLHHRLAEPAIALSLLAFAQPAALAGGPVALPGPSPRATPRGALPPARAPPGAPIAAFYPTGPPALL
jgi:hypothetical protein